MEPGYEKHHRPAVRQSRRPADSSRGCPRSAYLDVFAGAAGLTYGQAKFMDLPPRQNHHPLGHRDVVAGSLEIARLRQVQYIRRLIESRPMPNAFPTSR